jgi:N-acetylmuramoyl-L-alanine amidase
MGLHKTEANLEVAKRENEVVLMEKDYSKKYDGFDPNSPEANIIFSLYQNAFLDQSLRMASYVQREVKSKGRQVRGVKQAGFLVLFKTSMPSVLIETGFLSNPEEESFLSSTSGQEKMASSIFRAIKSYKMSIESPKSSIEFGVNKPDDTISDKPEEKPEKMETPVSKTDSPAVVVKADTGEKKNKPAPVKTNELRWGVQFYTSPSRIKSTDPRFKGLKDIRVDFENKTYKYSTGQLTSYDEALALQDKVRQKGFKDAFVVGFQNDKKISLKEALKIKAEEKN